MKLFEPGSIAVMEWGATMSLVDFFEVTRRTKKSVWLRKLQSQNETQDHWGQAGTCKPYLEGSRGQEFMMRIKHRSDMYPNGLPDEENHEYAFVKYQGSIKPWDGKAKRFDTYD